MGLLIDILRGRGARQPQPVSFPVALSSPFSSSNAQLVAWADHFNTDNSELTRATAMQVPAVAKARNLICSMVAGLDLIELDEHDKVNQPWLYRSSNLISPYHRMVWVLDDLFFYGWSLLAVQRDAAGQITDAVRVPMERWQIDADTSEVRVDGKPVKPQDVILIPGIFEGILTAGAPTVRGARALSKAWIDRAQSPIPMVELHQISDDIIEPDEAQEMVAAWNSARASGGATGFTDNRVELRVHGTSDASLFEDGRNAVVLDIARLTGIPAALLEGSQSEASLTYSTQEGRRNEFLDYALPMWIKPIEARLSLDDVCAPGRRIRFDLSSLTTTEQPVISAPIED